MTRRKSFVLFGLLVVFGLLIFAQSSTAYFVSDDWHWLWSARNRSVVMPDLLANYAGGHIGGSYNPLSSLWINTLYHFFSLNPIPYHIASIALHAVNAWMVAFFTGLLLNFFAKTEKKVAETASYAAGFLFLVWPTHAEAVNWIASAPHLLATFFYVAALNTYCLWRVSKKIHYIYISLFAGILAFFSKETAISLPFVIIAIEFMYQIVNLKKINVRKFWASAIFFTGMIFFLFMRFIATKLFFGTYADQTLIIRPVIWLHTFFTFFEEMLTLGLLRKIWSSFYFNSPFFGITLGIVVVVWIIFMIMKKKMWFVLTMVLLFIMTALPFVPLGFNRLSAETERYTYLPSVFFIIAFAASASRLGLSWHRKALYTLVFALSIVVVFNKNLDWSIAGSVSKEIVTTFSQYAVSGPKPEQYVFVGLPDTIGGAHVFRNNIREAIIMNYPNFSGNIVQIPVYTQMDRNDYRKKLLAWNADERGILAENEDKNFVVTGKDRAVTDIVTYELWNYDYATFSSDTIRLLFSVDFKNDILEGKVLLLAWDQGALKPLSYDPT